MMRFRLLGPLEVWDGARPVAVGGPQQRALLAALLLNANRVVSVDRLIGYLWGEQPPRTARSLLHGCVADLRRALCPDPAEAKDQPIVTRPPGYLIKVSSGDLDIEMFEELVASASAAAADESRPALTRAAALLAEALSLWQGPALDGIALDVCRHEATRLGEHRLSVLEQRVELDLRLGRHADLVGELQIHVQEHPLRERLWAQLMRALHGAGRQADALAAYRQIRQELVDQLGIEPGAVLQQVHREILAGEDPVAAPQTAAAPAQLPAPPATFVGRDRDLRWLDTVAAQAVDRVAIAVISGTAGIGKTALAVQWAHGVRDRFPDGQLYVDLRGFDPSGSAMSSTEAICGFLEALLVSPSRIPATLDGQASLYRTVLSGRRMLVVLDNARDEEQVRPLMPGSPGCPVLVTSRGPLTGLVVGHNAHPSTLDVLTVDEARTLLRHRLGENRVAAEPDAVDVIVSRCAGLPLALAIVAARAAVASKTPLTMLAEELHDASHRLDALAADDPAVDMRAVFSWSYNTLSRPRPASPRRT